MSKRLSSNEKALIMLKTLSLQGFSDNEIIKKLEENFQLKVSRNTLILNRKKLGITKGTKLQQNISDISRDNSLSKPPIDIKPENKAEWFRNQFKNTHLYTTLHTQFNTSEIDIYLQEYGIICCQFEDLVVSEFFQIDDFLKHRILINRQLTLMKQTQEKMEKINLWLLENQKKPNETKESEIERSSYIAAYNAEQAFLIRCNDRYDQLVTERDRIHKSLAATRRDRVSELKNSASNFFDIIIQIQQNDKINDYHGKYAEYSKIAANEESHDLRKTIEFPDGSKDFVLLDSETIGGISG